MQDVRAGRGLPAQSSKSAKPEAVCALTHCHSNDRHHKHYDTVLLIGNATLGAQATQAMEPGHLHHPRAANGECFVSPPGGATDTRPPQVRLVTWPLAPAGEGCGATGTRPLRGPLGLSAARPRTFACNLGAGHMWESSGGGKAQSGPNHCLFGGVWAQVKNENGPILFE